MKNCVKEWTVLLYANGHNELEPETWHAVQELQSHPARGAVTVAALVARECREVVKLLRPNLDFTQEDVWSGVRRYLFCDEQSSFEAQENCNMADPHCLYRFLVWGMVQHPAKRFLLVLSGHIYQFVGLCPDYSADAPYLLGFPELSSSIARACAVTGRKLDVLLLDTCYASTVEILYELGRDAEPCTQTVLTYIGKGPLQGLPYHHLLRLLEQTTQLSTLEVLEHLVQHLAISKSSYGLIALQVCHSTLQTVKELFSKLAAVYTACKHLYPNEFAPAALLQMYGEEYPWSLLLPPIHRLLESLVLAKREALCAEGGVLPIHLLSQIIPDIPRKELYCRLALCKDSHWAALICATATDSLPPCATAEDFSPLPLPKGILNAFLVSSDESIPLALHDQRTTALFTHKNWCGGLATEL